MLSGVSIVCFTASYLVTLALEITRLFFRSGVRGAIMLGFAGAGLFAHTVVLAHRAAEAAGSPLSSKQDWCLLTAWLLVVIYLYLTYYHPKTGFGVFILPLVLGLIGVGELVADAEPFAREPASKVWGTVHGVSLLLATVSVLVGFAAGLMDLGQAYRLKQKLPPMRGLHLPSLEWLQRANSRAVVISLLLMGVGILAGVILNLINRGRDVSLLPWYDPLVLSSLGMFGWLLLSSVVGIFYKPAREGGKVAYLTLVSFVFLVIALGIGLSVATQHSGQDPGARVQSRSGVQGSGFRAQHLRVRPVCVEAGCHAHACRGHVCSRTRQSLAACSRICQSLATSATTTPRSSSPGPRTLNPEPSLAGSHPGGAA